MSKDKLAEDYLGRGGDSQWGYSAPDYNLFDRLLLLLQGRKPKPSKPLTLFGVDKTPGEGENKFRPTTLNYSEIKKYNPHIAEKYLNSGITDREAQQIVNNGYVSSWKTKRELEQRNSNK